MEGLSQYYAYIVYICIVYVDVCLWSFLDHVCLWSFLSAVVDSSLPQSLKHIVSNAEYYGPSIYLPGTPDTSS